MAQKASASKKPEPPTQLAPARRAPLNLGDLSLDLRPRPVIGLLDADFSKAPVAIALGESLAAYVLTPTGPLRHAQLHRHGISAREVWAHAARNTVVTANYRFWTRYNRNGDIEVRVDSGPARAWLAHPRLATVIDNQLRMLLHTRQVLYYLPGDGEILVGSAGPRPVDAQALVLARGFPVYCQAEGGRRAWARPRCHDWATGTTNGSTPTPTLPATLPSPSRNYSTTPGWSSTESQAA